MKQRIKHDDETLEHIKLFLGSQRENRVRESEGEWKWVAFFLWNLVGTMFLASSELNKAQKQIIENLKGQRWFSMHSLFTFTDALGKL